MSAAMNLRKNRTRHACHHRKTTRLHAINNYDFALIRPFARNLDQSCSDRVFLHVIPFFVVALVRAKNMIEKARLPKLPGTEAELNGDCAF